MEPCTVIDLHCDTLTAFMAPTRCRDTLNDPRSAFSLSKVPRGTRWCQCCAIFLPDGLTPQEAAGYYAFHLHSFLTWNGENELGSGSATSHGLSPLGRAAIPALEEAGILVDVSHLNDQGFREMLEVARRPFAASHSNARSVCPHPRTLADWQVREMADRGCLIGLNYYAPFLRADGEPASLDDLCRHAEHLLSLGAGDCLALGSDFDGADLPPCLDCCGQVPGVNH